MANPGDSIRARPDVGAVGKEFHDLIRAFRAGSDEAATKLFEKYSRAI